MPFKDLREWLQKLEDEGELARVRVEVEKDHEIGAICRKVNDAGGPALYFERVQGYSIPLACNLMGTKKRFAMALEMAEEEITREWLRRTHASCLDPVVTSHGPCQENVLEGSEVDLLKKFPIPVWNELDGGPYITLPVVISRDPETGKRNAAMYRMQVHDRNTVGILMAPYRHAEMHRAKAAAEGRALPVAIAIGMDPAVLLAALAPLPYGVDELAVAGALRGEPVLMIKCKTIDLEVPAASEIVLEGEIPLNERWEEGPYGDFTGYYGGKIERPVVRIKAITHRNQPIYHGLYNGRPPTEEHIIRGLPIEIQIVEQCPIPGIKAVNLTLGGCANFNAVVSIKRPFEGYGKMMGMAILATGVGRHIKNVIIVDDDVDPFDWLQVEWAVATRVQPHRDVEILKEVAGVVLDPSIPQIEKVTGSARTSKMIIDATKFDAKDYEIACMPKVEIMEKVKREWKKYDIKLPVR